MSARFRTQPERLTAEQLGALERTNAEFRRVNYQSAHIKKPEPIEIPRPDYDLIEQAFLRWPMFDEEKQQEVELCLLFLHTDEPREHYLFKGVPCFPKDEL